MRVLCRRLIRGSATIMNGRAAHISVNTAKKTGREEEWEEESRRQKHDMTAAHSQRSCCSSGVDPNLDPIHRELEEDTHRWAVLNISIVQEHYLLATMCLSERRGQQWKQEKQHWTETKPLQTNGLPCCLGAQSEHNRLLAGTTTARAKGGKETFIMSQRQAG